MNNQTNTNEVMTFPVKLFNMIEFYKYNRDVKHNAKFKEVEQSILQEGYKRHQPVKLLNTLNKIVPGKFVPVDGQKRITICIANKIPFTYIIVNEDDRYTEEQLINDIIIENNKRERFTLQDCLKLHSKHSKLAQVLLEINEKYSISPDAFRLLFNVAKFGKGGVPDYTNYNTLYAACEKIKKMKKSFNITKAWIIALVGVIGKIETFDIDRLMDQMRKYPELYDFAWGSRKRILESINKLYNHRRQTDLLNVLVFFHKAA